MFPNKLPSVFGHKEVQILPLACFSLTLRVIDCQKKGERSGCPKCPQRRPPRSEPQPTRHDRCGASLFGRRPGRTTCAPSKPWTGRAEWAPVPHGQDKGKEEGNRKEETRHASKRLGNSHSAALLWPGCFRFSECSKGTDHLHDRQPCHARRCGVSSGPTSLPFPISWSLQSRHRLLQNRTPNVSPSPPPYTDRRFRTSSGATFAWAWCV